MTEKKSGLGKRFLSIVAIVGVAFGLLIPVPVQAAITNEGIIKLIDIQADVDPSYNPDGSKIVFSVSDPILNSGSIWILDLKTSGINQVNMPNNRDYLYTEWSPIGDIIAYSSYYNGVPDICTINLDGSNENCLTTDQVFDVGNPRFSPDGDKIVYFSHIHDPYDIGDIWVMNSDGGNKMQLTNDREYQASPSFSPDGTKIAYASGSGIYLTTNIWVMDADGNNKKQLTFGNVLESEPSWSPDGRYIAYQKSDCRDYCPWNIWVMRADGTEQTQLTNGAIDGIDGGQPNWHPNGKKIVFVSHGTNSNWDIYEMTLGGTYIPVTIDIKPGSDPNSFNNNRNGVIPVAILGNVDFDIRKINPDSVKLEGLAVKEVGKGNKLLAHYEDVNSDGYEDLIIQIEDNDSVFSIGDTLATLTGNLIDGTPIEGKDTVRIVP